MIDSEALQPTGTPRKSCTIKLLSRVILAALAVLVVAIVTLPFWGMGTAVFLDSERTIVSRAVSPDGKRTAQVERMVVGGVPSIVVMVRSARIPNWYLTGCVAAHHYEESAAQIRWLSNSMLEVRHADDQRFWELGSAPFHHGHCADLTVRFSQGRP
jgi:hypothetical protein